MQTLIVTLCLVRSAEKQMRQHKNMEYNPGLYIVNKLSKLKYGNKI